MSLSPTNLASADMAIELSQMPTCSTCSNTFSAHFFNVCKNCRKMSCCVCSYNSIDACSCMMGFEILPTKNRYKLKHTCNSEFNRTSDSNTPPDKVEMWLIRMTQREMTAIEISLIFKEICSILSQNPNLYFPFRKISKQISSYDPILVSNISKILVPTPKGLSPLGEVQNFFTLVKTARKIGAKKRVEFTVYFEVIKLFLLVSAFALFALQSYKEYG